MTSIDRFAEIAAGATELTIKLEKGDLRLRTVDGPGPEWSFEFSSKEEIPPDVRREGSRLVIEQTRRDGWHHHGRRMDVELTVPAEVSVYELNTGHGKAEIEGTSGRLRLNSGHGGVQLRRGSGSAEIDTGHGGLEIDGFNGPLHLNTGHGHVQILDHEGEADLRTGHGRIDIQRHNGRLRATSGHGDVQVVDAGGSIELKSGHGSVEVANPRELKLEVKNGMGGVRIEGGSLLGLHVRTGKGNVECAAALQPGQYDVNTGMGNIAFGLADGGSVRVDLQTSFGAIDSDLPLVQVGRSGPMGFGGGRMVGSIGEGDPLVELTLRSGKGNIALRRAGAAPRWTRPNTWWRGIEDPAALTQGAADAIEAATRSAMRAAGPIAAKAAEEALRQAEEAMQHAAREVERSIEGVFGQSRPPFGSPPSGFGPPPDVGPTPPGVEPPAPPLGPPPPAAPSPPTPVPAQDDATLAILERLSRGEITVEEAQAELNKR
jgi:hypothetical protein